MWTFVYPLPSWFTNESQHEICPSFVYNPCTYDNTIYYASFYYFQMIIVTLCKHSEASRVNDLSKIILLV